MPREMQDFRVSPRAEEHMLRKHGVALHEALEVAKSSPVYQPAAGAQPEAADPSERRYLVAGKTAEGGGRGSCLPTRVAAWGGSSPPESPVAGQNEPAIDT